MKVTTDHRPRRLEAWIDLPEKQRDDYDYLDHTEHFTPRFVRYRGAWYDTFDTQPIRTGKKQLMYECVVDESSPLSKWDAMLTETFFSGVLFKFVDEDLVICGRYYT